MNFYQQSLARTYNGGGFKHLKSLEEVELCDDPVFQSMMDSLAHVTSMEEAMENLKRIRRNQQELEQGLHAPAFA